MTLESTQKYMQQLHTALQHAPSERDRWETKNKPMAGPSFYADRILAGVPSMVRKATRHARMGQYARSVLEGVGATALLPLVPFTLITAPRLQSSRPREHRSPAGYREDYLARSVMELRRHFQTLATMRKSVVEGTTSLDEVEQSLAKGSATLHAFDAKRRAAGTEARIRTSGVIAQQVRAAHKEAAAMRAMFEDVRAERARWAGIAAGVAALPTQSPAQAATPAQWVALTLHQEDGKSRTLQVNATALLKEPTYFRGLVDTGEQMAEGRKANLEVRVAQLEVAERVLLALQGQPLQLRANQVVPAYLLLDQWLCVHLLPAWEAQVAALANAARCTQWIATAAPVAEGCPELLPKLYNAARTAQIGLSSDSWALALGPVDGDGGGKIVGDSDGGHAILRTLPPQPNHSLAFDLDWRPRTVSAQRVSTGPLCLEGASLSLELRGLGSGAGLEDHEVAVNLLRVPESECHIGGLTADARGRIVGRQGFRVGGALNGQAIAAIGSVLRYLEAGQLSPHVDAKLVLRKDLRLPEGAGHPQVSLQAHLQFG